MGYLPWTEEEIREYRRRKIDPLLRDLYELWNISPTEPEKRKQCLIGILDKSDYAYIPLTASIKANGANRPAALALLEQEFVRILKFG